VVGPPAQLHSDQGCNFESHILSELCKAFKISKSCTIPHHPMADGLVECMNRTLLDVLHKYTHREGDWKEYLQLLLYIYCTTKHCVTDLSPHEVLFGYNPPSPSIPTQNAPEVLNPDKNCDQLQKRLLELGELVETNIVKSVAQQKLSYYSGYDIRLASGQKVLVSKAN